MTTYFTVRTPRGYVGRLAVGEALRDDVPAPFAYTYDLVTALRIADATPGAVVLDSDGTPVDR